VKDLKALVLTNQLEAYAGSEIVALEVAETFKELGCDTDVYSGHIAEPAQSDITAMGVNFGIAEDCPDPFSYDIIWSQHHILPYLISRHYSEDVIWPFIVTVSLSPFEPYEMPGAIAEASNLIVANSKETYDRLVSAGVDSDKIEIFHNSAPSRFSVSRHHSPAINNIAIISNHAPEEVLGAAKILAQSGLNVDHIGLPKNQRRVSPELLLHYDAIITIGKSVQYCILSETPVFIYDQFGGPGWLTEINYTDAATYNFSGRCCAFKKTAEEIAEQLITEYKPAIASIQKIKKTCGYAYNLDSYIEKLIKSANTRNRRQTISPKLAKMISREGIISRQSIQFYRKLQTQAADMAAQNSDFSKQISNLAEQLSRLQTVLEKKDQTINNYQEEVARLEQSRHVIISSNSWKLTKPLRVLRRSVHYLLNGNTLDKQPFHLISDLSVTRLRNAMRYLLRGDFKGLLERLKFYRRENSITKAIQNIHKGDGSKWAIMSTPHTLFLARSISAHLQTHNIHADVITSSPLDFEHDFYIVLCPQMFETLPPSERRILFQLEQSVSSRWFSEKYISDLENSLAVFEYSLTNIEFLETKGLKYPHVHYIPIGLPSPDIHIPNSLEKEYDFLFYGDSNSSPRRRTFLSKLGKKFNVKICNNLFGDEMHTAIRKAKVVVNIHYYEGALLEMPRIQECISLGVPVLSEGTKDQLEYPELTGAVRFFKENSIEDMLLQANEILADVSRYNEQLTYSAKRSSARFSFMLDRALVAIGLLPVGTLQKNIPYLPKDNNVVALSLPETISRRRTLAEVLPKNVTIFDGARYRPGWIGCGLSFNLLAKYALEKKFKYLTVFEDDVLLPDDYEKRISEILEYLTERSGEWDVFSGMMAEVHPDTKILSVEVHNGVTYATVNRMVSTVYNIYNKSALNILSQWDPTNHDVEKNPIDRYLQNANDLRVIVSLPFFAGHREELDSTLWGFQNERYAPMIAKAEAQLREKADQWLREHGKDGGL